MKKKLNNARRPANAPAVAVKMPVAAPAPAPAAVIMPQVAAPAPAEGANITPARPGRPAGARGATATNIVLPPANLGEMLTEIPGLAALQLPSNPIPWSDAEKSVFLSPYGGKIEKAPEVLQSMLNGPKGHEKATLEEIHAAGGSAKIEFAQIKAYTRRLGELMTAQAQMFDENEAVRVAAAARLEELQKQTDDETEE